MCEFHAEMSPIWENDTWEVSILEHVNSIFASQNKWPKTTAYYMYTQDQDFYQPIWL